MTSKTRFLNYGLIVMTVSHVLTHVFGGIHTAIFGLLRDEFSLTLQQLGIIAAIPPLIDALVAIPAGLITDRIGSRKMLLASFVFAAVGALLAGFANGPVVLVVAICLIYINTTIYHPASYSFNPWTRDGAPCSQCSCRSPRLGLETSLPCSGRADDNRRLHGASFKRG